MKETYANFSLTDFLAYLFPGIVMVLALAALLLLTPASQKLMCIPLNLATGAVGITLAYFLGVIVSSFTYPLERLLYMVLRKRDPIESIQLPGFEKQVRSAFQQFVGVDTDWSQYHFFVARSLLGELAPRAAAAAERQNSLRQLRRNSLVPVLFLAAAGVCWGLSVRSWNEADASYGMGLVVLSIVGWVFITYFLIAVGMHRNRSREVREICSALLVLQKIIESKKDKK